MSLTLHVDAARWRTHLEAVARVTPGLVPVAKGNGYGFGNARLAGEAARLRVDTLAVGTPSEVADVAGPFAGRLLVLSPWDGSPDEADEVAGGRVVRTVANADVLAGLAARPSTSRPRTVVELFTSVRRHGVGPDRVGIARDAGVEDFAVHLPIHRPNGVDPLGEAEGWLHRLADMKVPVRTLWVSHLTDDELGHLAAAHPEITLRARIGTRLWLGDLAALQVGATVLDVWPVARGERYGYRQQRAPLDGRLVVVSGGTAHGIGLEAPGGASGIAGRTRALARGTLACAGLTRSPFRWAGHALWFAEPAHMQESLLWLPGDAAPPAREQELTARVRFTTAHPDAVILQ